MPDYIRVVILFVGENNRNALLLATSQAIDDLVKHNFDRELSKLFSYRTPQVSSHKMKSSIFCDR